MHIHSRWLPHEAGWENVKCAKLSSRQKGGYYTIYFDFLNTFLVTTWFYMLFIVLMSSVLFYNVENSKNKELDWVGVQTFGSVNIVAA
jgi:hypothetical protein